MRKLLFAVLTGTALTFEKLSQWGRQLFGLLVIAFTGVLFHNSAYGAETIKNYTDKDVSGTGFDIFVFWLFIAYIIGIWISTILKQYKVINEPWQDD